jgi:hypothetical protein
MERYTPTIPSDSRTSVRLMNRRNSRRNWRRDGRSRRSPGRSGATRARSHYWVNKHGLVSTFAAKHAGRGGIPRERLEELVEAGYTVQQMARELRRGSTTVRYWLRKHGLSTGPSSSHTAWGPSARGHQALSNTRVHRARADLARHAVSLPPLPGRGGFSATSPRQADPRPRGRRRVPDLRLRPLSGSPSVPPCRPEREKLRACGSGPRAIA